MIKIRETTDVDRPAMLTLNRDAFGQEEEATLVSNVLDDPSARPILSLMAYNEDQPAGHILFTRAHLTAPENDAFIYILAPLAVAPDRQRKGVGSALIETGLQHLSDRGVDLVFVLGDPAYYGRSGFMPATPLGLDAPYPLPKEYDNAWMVQALGEASRTGALGTIHGRVTCCKTLGKAEYWLP